MDPNQENISLQDGSMESVVTNIHNGAIDAIAGQIDGLAKNTSLQIPSLTED